MSKKDLENKQSSDYEDDFYKKRKSSNFVDDFYKKRKSSNFVEDFYKNKQSSNLVENTFKNKKSITEKTIPTVKPSFVLPGDSDNFKEFAKENPDLTPDELHRQWNQGVMARNIAAPIILSIIFFVIIFAATGSFGAPIAGIAIIVLVLLPLYFEATRKAIGLFNVVLGIIFTITGFAAIFGIPMILFGFLAFFWPSNKRN